MRHGTPTVSIPAQSAGISSKIKVWGLRTEQKFKIVIINKDQNASVSNDYVNVKIGGSTNM